MPRLLLLLNHYYYSNYLFMTILHLIFNFFINLFIFINLYLIKFLIIFIYLYLHLITLINYHINHAVLIWRCPLSLKNFFLVFKWQDLFLKRTAGVWETQLLLMGNRDTFFGRYLFAKSLKNDKRKVEKLAASRSTEL